MKRVQSVKRAIYKEHLATLEVLDEIVKIEEKKEYLRVSSSLYRFLTVKMKYSEGAAMRRIHGARVIARYPEAREYLQKREISLCTLSLVAKKVLGCKEREEGLRVLDEIRGKSKREVEGLEAFRRDTVLKDQVRVISAPPPPIQRKVEVVPPPLSKAPETSKAQPEESPPPPQDPLYRISFTTTKEVFQLVDEVRAGMSHRFGGGRATLGEIFEAGVRSLHQEIQKKRTPRGTATTTQKSIPVEVRRRIFERDNSECQYRLEDGSKCCS